MSIKIQFALIIFITQLSFAQNSTEKHAQDFSLRKSENSSLIEVTATPPKDTHFNTEAPVKVIQGKKTFKPKNIAKDKISFSLEKAATKEDSLSMSAYLCDDANTFCEEHTVSLKLGGTPQTEKPIHIFSENKKETKSAKIHYDKSGFIVENPEAAFELAKKTNKAIFIDFYAIWCPPCNMMDKDIFSKPEFKSKTKDLVKLKLDADKESSWALKSKYKVRGYPTYIFATPTGEVIYHSVGYIEKNKFYQTVKSTIENKNEGFDSLLVKANNGDRKAKDRVGQIYLEQGSYENAVKYLTETSDHKEDYFDALLNSMPEMNDKKISVALEIIQKFPNSYLALNSLDALVGHYEEKGDKESVKKYLEMSLSSCNNILSNLSLLEKGRYTISKEDILSMQADVYEKLEQKDNAKKIWQELVSNYKSRKNLERADVMDLAYALEQLGQFEEAQKHYTSMQKKYPNEFTFYYLHASQLMKNKKFTEALPLSKLAFQNAYGDNKLTSANLLGDILIETQQKEEAKKLWADLLAAVKLPEDKLNRTHRYYSKIKKKLDNLENKSESIKQ